jgi:arginine transport system substrate-binding protein
MMMSSRREKGFLMKCKWLRLLCLGLVYLFCSTTAQAELKIGVMFFDPPLVMSASQGFHVDLANIICQGLQEKCRIIPMIWDQLFLALDKGDIDLIMGVFMTPERAQKYLFSIPYMISKGQFIALTKSNLSRYEQLKGLKVGTLKEETGTGVFLGYLQAAFPDFFKEIVEFKDIDTMLTALDNNSIKAGFMHSTAVNYWVANSKGIFSTLGSPVDIGNGYTIMALPDKQKLIDKINKQIQLIMADGDFVKLYNTYFGSGESSN